MIDDSNMVVPMPPAPRAAVAADPRAVPPGMQYLYGSGEGAAASLQAWNALVAFVDTRARARPRDSVVLAAGSTLLAPRFVPCGRKPYAAIFDIDETVLLNRGFEYDAATGQPYADARWRAFEITGGMTTTPTPGAKLALDALRRMHVRVVFNSNRSAANAAATTATIERWALGPAVHGDTLYLKGDDATGSAKDGRRARIAERYCVVAMAGDQLGDFSDLFAPASPGERRGVVQARDLARLWGAGWFVLPNPVYGTALKGDMDDVFPPDARWAPEP